MVSHADRLAFANQYIDAAREIELQTKDPEARCYWNHLLAHGVVVAPERSSGDNVEMNLVKVLNGTGSVDRRYLIPILVMCSEDQSLNRHFPGIWQRPDRASHQSGNNMIYLKTSDEETAFLKGCAILHETGHAYKAAAEGRIGNEDADEKISPKMLLEEGDLHYLEARLWKEKGGSAYFDILDRAVYRLKKSGGSASNCLGLNWNEEWLLVLDTLFGQSSNRKVRQHRMGSFAIHVNFELIDRNFVSNKRQARANIIAKTYKEMNFRQ